MAVDDEDQPLAFGDLEHDGHIGYLYCAPEAAGGALRQHCTSGWNEPRASAA